MTPGGFGSASGAGSSFAPPPPGPQAPPPPTQGGSQAPAGISGLVGGVNQTPPPGPTPDQKTQAYMEQVRNLHMAIDALATDHPEASSDLNDAKNALTNSMSKVASSMTSPEAGPAPPTF